MSILLQFWVSCLFVLKVLAVTGPEVASYLDIHLSRASDIFLPSDIKYTQETTQRWNQFSSPTYIIAVKPATDVDVQKIIEYASRHNISFLGTGGGHGYSTTLGDVQRGIEIDLGHFSDVFIDIAAKTMTIGGSVRFANITGPLYEAKKEFPISLCSCVGVVGATLGGGLGPYAGMHGLMIDALQSVKMVTGTGSLIEVSNTSHPDLWWGMRGAGFNFGIVTSATYKIYDFTYNGHVMNADFLFHPFQNGSLFEYAQSFVGRQPDNFYIDIGIGYNEEFGGTYISANFIYAGPLREGKALIQPLIDLGPFKQNITEIAWKDSVTQSRFGGDAFACIKGDFHSVWSLNLYQFDVSTMVSVVEYMYIVFSQYPALRQSYFAIDMSASRVTESIPDEETAYPYRHALAHFILGLAFQNASSATTAHEVGSHAREIFKSTSGASTNHFETHVNFGHGDEGDLGWYTRRKLPRLYALKQKYDPDRLFSFYNPLGTKSP